VTHGFGCAIRSFKSIPDSVVDPGIRFGLYIHGNNFQVIHSRLQVQGAASLSSQYITVRNVFVRLE
jgi:hypothetical protein